MASNSEVGQLKIKLILDTSGLKESEKEAENAARSINDVLGRVSADLISKSIQTAIGKVKELAGEVVKVGTSFDSTMSKVAAISGATGNELEALKEKARQMGKQTVFSASESAEAFTYMAMAGWKTEDMLEGIDGILNLAAASGADLATTSDIVTDALTAMGYEARDAARFADILAAASANSNTNVEMMGGSLKYVGTVAGALKYSMEDVSVALGLMANSGLKAESAGVALRSILSRLASPTNEVKTAMDVLGISLTDGEGNMLSLDEVMKQLRTGFNNLSETQKAEMASTIAGKEAMSGLLAIVNASESDYNKLTLAVNNSAGAAQKMAEIMNDNVAGKLKLLQSQIEDIMLAVWDRLAPTVEKALDKISAALQSIDWDAVANAIGAVLDTVVDGFVWVIDHGDLVTNVFKVLAAALVSVKLGEFAKSVIETKEAISKTISVVHDFGTGLITLATNPITWVVAGIAGIAAAIIGITTAIKDAEANMGGVQSSIKRMNDTLKESHTYLQQSQEEWGKLKEKQTEMVSTGMQEIGYYQQLLDELGLITDENGRVKDSYSDRAQFIVTTLSSALGTEISYTDGIIEGYQDMRENVLKTIEAKKAELILASQEEAYKQAFTERIELIKQIRQVTEEQRIAEEEGREEDRLRIAQHLSELENQYDQYTLTIGQYEDNMALYSAGKYDEMTQTIWQYSNEYTSAEEAIKATLLDEVSVTAADLASLEKMYAETGDEIYKQKAEAAQASLDKHQDEMSKYFGTTEEYLLKTTAAWDENLEQQLSSVTGHNVQFLNAGEGLVTMMIDGVVAKEGMSQSAMANLVKNTITEIKLKKQAALNAGTGLIDGVNEGLSNLGAQQKALNSATRFSQGVTGIFHQVWEENSPSRVTENDGTNLIYGVNNGLNNSNAQAGVFGSIRSFASGIISKFKNTLGIQSPSKIMREVVGKNIAAGIGVGFDDEIGDVEKDMQKEIQSLAANIYSEVPEFEYSVSGSGSMTLSEMVDFTSGDDYEKNEPKPREPLVVQLMLDGKQIQQVILQDIRRAV